MCVCGRRNLNPQKSQCLHTHVHVVCLRTACLGVGIQQLVRCGAKEPVARVKPCLQELVKELPEHPSPVDAGLVQPLGVGQRHP